MTTAPTPAVDVLLAALRTLTAAEQDTVLDGLVEHRVQRLASDGSLAGRMIASLVRVAEEVGGTPTISDYRRVQPILSAAGEELVTFARLYKYFDGAWFRAVEAFEMADVTTPRMIEARLRRRRVGRVGRYSDEVMQTALAQSAEFYGYPPSTDEYDAWRERELELARERGDNDLQLPSVQPYRRRWSTWLGALNHFGYDTSQVGSYRGLKPRGARRAGRSPRAPQ